jgi:tetratricopeptide (TPR) repeat protein
MKEAIGPYQDALKIDPAEPQALSGLGTVYATYYLEMLQRDTDSEMIFQQAEEKLGGVLKASPSNVPARFNLIRLHLMRIDYRVKHQKKLTQEEFETVQRHCDELLGQNPGIVMGRELKAFLFLRKCQYQANEHALDLQDLEQALRLNEELAQTDRKGPAHVRLGVLYELKGEPVRALQEYDEGLPNCKMPSERAQAHIYRGKLFMSMGQNDKARADFEEALRLDPSAKPDLQPLLDKLR